MDTSQCQQRKSRPNGAPHLGTLAVEQLGHGQPHEQGGSQRYTPEAARSEFRGRQSRHSSLYGPVSRTLRGDSRRNGLGLHGLCQPRHPLRPHVDQPHRGQRRERHCPIHAAHERSDFRTHQLRNDRDDESRGRPRHSAQTALPVRTEWPHCRQNRNNK